MKNINVKLKDPMSDVEDDVGRNDEEYYDSVEREKKFFLLVGFLVFKFCFIKMIRTSQFMYRVIEY